MAILQVSRLGAGFTVLVDGVASGFFTTRPAAVKAALEMKADG